LTIAYNNEAQKGFKAGWGFSCLIENGKRILFDTGDDPEKLSYNLKKLNKKPEDIDLVVISHEHWDHTGGLNAIINANPKIKVLRVKDFPEPAQITENIYTTGLIKNSTDEQSLILETNKGIVVIVGCSHPGVDKILEIAKKYGRIYSIIGGFHGFSDFKALEGIEIIGACHCTQYMNKIKERFSKQFREIKAGDIIEI
jgi:7,8-dihydropterin-6-yl-methyl-4-(beta-D-ribofuranosyl)aminobenzene 5'-phosphate synthase